MEKAVVSKVMAVKLKNGKFIPFFKRGKFRNKDNSFHWCWFNIAVLKKHQVLIDSPEELADCWRLEPYYHVNGKEVTHEWMMKALDKAFENPVSFESGAISIGYGINKGLVPKSETELLYFLKAFREDNPVLMWKEDKWN